MLLLTGRNITDFDDESCIKKAFFLSTSIKKREIKKKKDDEKLFL
jgi:hypothetical protein